MKFAILATLVTLGGLLSSCGYSFQSSKSPLLDKMGIRKIFIAPLRNETYKPGVENMVYNELVRVIEAHRRVRIVPRAEDSDAILVGSVTQAVYVPGATQPASSVFPSERITRLKGSSQIIVPADYNASLACNFTLNQRIDDEKTKSIWGASFSKNKSFPANNQLDIFGTTSALINESEFDRALQDLAASSMADLHESMLAMF